MTDNSAAVCEACEEAAALIDGRATLRHGWDKHGDADAIRASCRHATPAAPADGWRLVPVEPTDEMLYMMCRAINNIDEKRDSYRAMLAAAPAHPKAPADHAGLLPSVLVESDQLANVAERLLGAINKLFAANELASAKETAVNVLARERAQEEHSEYWNAVRCSIYEYRKRAEKLRAALSAPQSEGVVVPREIDRELHRSVLDVWNNGLIECETLETMWPKLVDAMLSAPQVRGREEGGGEEMSRERTNGILDELGFPSIRTKDKK